MKRPILAALAIVLMLACGRHFVDNDASDTATTAPATDAGPDATVAAEEPASVPASSAQLDACRALGAQIKLGNGNTAYPVGPADGGLIYGTFPDGLTVGGLNSTGPIGTCIGVADAGGVATVAWIVPGADGGTVAFVAGGDLYGSATAQYVQSLLGDGGKVYIYANGSNLDFAADASPSLSQDPTTAAHGADIALNPQWSSAADGGGGHLNVTLPVPVGAGPESAFQVFRGDGGSPVAQLASLGPTAAGLCLAGYGGDTCTEGNSLLWTDRSNGAVYLQATPNGDSDSWVVISAAGSGATQIVLEIEPSVTYSYAPAFRFLPQGYPLVLGAYGEGSDTAPTSMSFWGMAACPNGTCSSPTNKNGGTAYLGGGAANNPETNGLSGPVRIVLNQSTSQTVIEAAEVVLGQRVTAFNQLGSGVTATLLPSGSGSGISWFADAAIIPTVAPQHGVTFWSQESAGLASLWAWPAGGSAFQIGGGSGGITALTTDVIAVGPGSVSAEVEGMWHTPINSDVASAAEYSPLVYDSTNNWHAAPLLISQATAVTGQLQTANGGTGLTTPGTAGNVLTSNGSTWYSATPSSGGSFTAGGDLSGTSTDQCVSNIGTCSPGTPVDVYASELDWEPGTSPVLYYGGTNTFEIEVLGPLTFQSGSSYNATIIGGSSVSLDTSGAVTELTVTSSATTLVPSTLQFAATTSSPTITQPAVSGAASSMSIVAQSGSGGIGSGGSLNLQSGAGAIGDGEVNVIGGNGVTFINTASLAYKAVFPKGIREHVNVQTGSYAFTTQDNIVVTTCSSSCTVTLPTSPTPTIGDEYTVCGIASLGGPTVTLSAGSGQTINGASSLTSAGTSYPRCITVVAYSTSAFVAVSSGAITTTF